MAEAVRVEMLGADTMAIRFRDRADRARDLSPLFKGKLDKHVTTVFRRQFESEGAFGGQKWPPLKASTRRQKARRNLAGMPILQASRELWASLTKSSSAPRAFLRVTKDSYERGTTVPYAIHHQRGRGKGLATRQVVPSPMPREVLRTWARLVGEYVNEDRA